MILLLPGTCCHWKRNFGKVTPRLMQDFHVVCVSYDGFDEAEDTVFSDMLMETKKIEDYIKEHFGGHICAAIKSISKTRLFTALIWPTRNCWCCTPNCGHSI